MYSVYIRNRTRGEVFDFVELNLIDIEKFTIFEHAITRANNIYDLGIYSNKRVDNVTIIAPVGQFPVPKVLYCRERFPEEIESAMYEHNEIDYIPAHTNYMPPRRNR